MGDIDIERFSHFWPFYTLGCVKHDELPTRWSSDPVFPRSSQALRSWSLDSLVGPKVHPCHWMLPLQANMFWADAGDDWQKHMNLIVYLICLTLLAPLPGGSRALGLLKILGSSGNLWGSFLGVTYPCYLQPCLTIKVRQSILQQRTDGGSRGAYNFYISK